MTTIQITCTVGVNPGYNHKNEIPDQLTHVHDAWMKVARKLHQETGIFIAVTAHKAKSFYLPEWGCPPGGEDIVILTSVCNKEFHSDERKWRQVAIRAGQELGRELKQNTVYLLITEVDFMYIKNDG